MKRDKVQETYNYDDTLFRFFVFLMKISYINLWKRENTIPEISMERWYYMLQMKGRQSVLFQEPVQIISHACVGGKKEGEGPIGKHLDLIVDDPMFGKENWEESESSFLKTKMKRGQKMKEKRGDAFSDCHPAVNFFWFAAVILITMLNSHPVFPFSLALSEAASRMLSGSPFSSSSFVSNSS